ncbi:hypothetical protein B0T11DRAFT_280182 [Plectosphaerella cucumerina]|uniref:Secreted protein n=1 Tax=Plectosphaerella cucumerina TaxID=40658 RepID=A0A8K0TG46_9PEZI|nr:hypothetical protein B0T11DRAFT_280182 [Plectosphaerella cucumerina]
MAIFHVIILSSPCISAVFTAISPLGAATGKIGSETTRGRRPSTMTNSPHNQGLRIVQMGVSIEAASTANETVRLTISAAIISIVDAHLLVNYLYRQAATVDTLR